MSDLDVSKKKVYELFTKGGGGFLIPDYQRPYSWEREQCETLWEDFVAFAFPNGDKNDFNNERDNYFLGTIVTYPNASRQDEVIDGQQRLITLTLLMRAFYNVIGDQGIRYKVEECIWYRDNDNNPDKTRTRIKSEVAAKEDIAEFNKILSSGAVDRNSKSNYAQNYRFFQGRIADFKKEYPDDFGLLPRRILENCIILPIETNSPNMAMRIFSTLNDRGLSLSASDIFKSQLYKFYEQIDKESKDNFVKRWKDLAETCNRIFHPRKGTPIDDLFRKYMYYLLAEGDIKSDTFPDLRDFYDTYGGGNYKILHSEETFENLVKLANFWNDVATRNNQRFTARALKLLFILSYAPHNIWSYVVSLYFMGNRNSKDNLEDRAFCEFLNKITAMIWMHTIVNPGTYSIRRPFFVEFGNILRGNEIQFRDFKQPANIVRDRFEHTRFSGSRLITRAMLAWHIFSDDEQDLLPIGTILETEHIYAKNRAEKYPLRNPDNLESLGNKSLLEKRINIRATDYSFNDKKRYYLGYNGGKKSKRDSEKGTEIVELRRLAKEKIDFTEADIIERNSRILDRFIDYLGENGLLK